MGILEGKVAVVTGGSHGIGFATAHRFVAEGARVFITGRSQHRLDDALAELGDNAVAVRGDAADLEHLDLLYATIAANVGHLDIVVANPALRLWRRLPDVTPADFDAVYGVNVRGVLFTVQKALPLLRDGGSVVLVGSTLSHRGQPGLTLYASTKATLRAFARTWAAELGDRRIRVNLISAGAIDTAPPITGTVAAGEAAEAAARRHTMLAAAPLQRAGRPDELAATILFLASTQSSYMTGAELVVDGGLTVV
ncbi:SDR family NAD(P)-dependent oxidoreductase [Mycolicibacterium pyrenivorans]|uniref:SDR family NAD(P)-dependent oxidoreductase n=1 Tax=Mycolicibacterium pyrenivorans TaxID=187102 RepID=UPI0021F3A118|nr:SDR family oxidoreductase [Mycolicibacterium pyrenivorans]MCV7154910.1 SDR family oxidoreductase [Mycolicibacterium pyrenivorans]